VSWVGSSAHRPATRCNAEYRASVSAARGRGRAADTPRSSTANRVDSSESPIMIYLAKRSAEPPSVLMCVPPREIAFGMGDEACGRCDRGVPRFVASDAPTMRGNEGTSTAKTLRARSAGQTRHSEQRARQTAKAEPARARPAKLDRCRQFKSARSAGRPQNHPAIRKLALRLAGWL